jgi:hypothetical protein
VEPVDRLLELDVFESHRLQRFAPSPSQHRKSYGP